MLPVPIWLKRTGDRPAGTSWTVSPAGGGGPSSPRLLRLPAKRLRLDLLQEEKEAHPILKTPDEQGLSLGILKRLFVV